jgi:hypothetical protein
MTHMHYSPFQFATSLQASEGDVCDKKVMKKLGKMTKKDSSKAKLIPTTMSCKDAHMIPGTPNAFISPNPPDAMRMIRSVFGSC